MIKFFFFFSFLIQNINPLAREKGRRSFGSSPDVIAVCIPMPPARLCECAVMFGAGCHVACTQIMHTVHSVLSVCTIYLNNWILCGGTARPDPVREILQLRDNIDAFFVVAGVVVGDCVHFLCAGILHCNRQLWSCGWYWVCAQACRGCGGEELVSSTAA